MEKGRLIVIEGIDGSGKGTLCKQLLNNSSLKNPIVLKNIIDEGATGTAIRNIIQDGHCEIVSKERLAMLYLSELMYVIFKEDGVMDQLLAGRDVIVDRYYFSTLCYAPCDLTDVVIKNALAGETLLEPDLVICLTVDPKVAIQRIIGRGTTSPEYYDHIDKLAEINKRYLELNTRSENIVYIESNEPISDDKLNKIIDTEIGIR